MSYIVDIDDVDSNAFNTMDSSSIDLDFFSESEESLLADNLYPSDIPQPAPTPENPPIQLDNTHKLREQQVQFPYSIAARVRTILYFMDAMGLNLPLFLDYLSWGDVECVQDPRILCYERTALMVSDELPIVLKRWLSPPRNADTHDVQAMGGKKYLEQFVVDCMQEIGLRKLISLRSTVQHLKKDLSQAQLMKMTLDVIIETFKGMSFGAV